MFVLEPIPPVSALMMALRMAKVAEGPLGSDLTALDTRLRTTALKDRNAWLALYVDLDVFAGRVLEVHGDTGFAGTDRIVSLSASSNRASDLQITNVLQRQTSDWQARLSEQQAQLLDKCKRGVEELPVDSELDATRGERVFRFTEKRHGAFLAWFEQALQLWLENNETLVATRANDALKQIGISDAEIAPPSLTTGAVKRWQRFEHRVTDPGLLDSLSSMQRFVMSGVSAATSIGFVVSRVLDSDPARKSTGAHVLSWALGATFVIAIIVGVYTLPKRRRQARARLEAQAREALEAKTLKAIADTLSRTAEAQRNAIRKQLTSEGHRLSRPSPSTTSPEPVKASPSIRLSPLDVKRLRGEWREAISARIVELRGELAS
ncbi:MAG: hypothetical protein KIT84_22400 [Labilithrix sp.]|nr:hypothetical protein [Labilithrix sp.]MCW5813796.1 hypothetical protein [Labilithrix sp.]